jgi:hypothetical protein
MFNAAKAIAPTEVAKDTQTFAAAQAIKSLKATASSYSPQAEAERRKWGVETRAVRSIHVRKY